MSETPTVMDTFDSEHDDSKHDRVVQSTKIDAGKVAKPFNSEYRRHRPDDPIARAELVGSRLDFDHLVERGFIVAQS